MDSASLAIFNSKRSPSPCISASHTHRNTATRIASEPIQPPCAHSAPPSGPINASGATHTARVTEASGVVWILLEEPAKHWETNRPVWLVDSWVDSWEDAKRRCQAARLRDAKQPVRPIEGSLTRQANLKVKHVKPQQLRMLGDVHDWRLLYRLPLTWQDS